MPVKIRHPQAVIIDSGQEIRVRIPVIVDRTTVAGSWYGIAVAGGGCVAGRRYGIEIREMRSVVALFDDETADIAFMRGAPLQ